MRDGRRNRLGLVDGTEGTVQDTYIDRILSDVDVAGEPNILSLDPDANVRTTDQRYLSDAYNYYLGGGYDADFEQNLIDQGGGVQAELGAPISAPGEGMLTQEAIDELANYPVNREYGEEMDIGYGEGQVDPNLAAAVGGKDTTPLGGANLVTLPSGDVFAADDPMLQEKMDYNQQDPKFWEDAKNKFIETGQDVGNIFTDLKNKGIDVL